MALSILLPQAFETFSTDLLQLPDVVQAEYQEAISSTLGLQEETKGLDIRETLKVAHKRGDLDNGDTACRMLSGFAKKTSNPKEIEKIIEKHKPSFPKRETEFVGREEDVKEISKRLRNKVIPGINLFGESGVGKTTLAQEVAKTFGEFKVKDVNLRDIQDMETVSTLILLEFGVQLKSKSSLDKVYECLDKTLTQKTLVILDNVEQLVKGSSNKEFIGFLKTVFETKACKNKLLILILTSQDELNDRSLKGKFFSEYEVKPLARDISKNFITKRRNDVIGAPEEESEEALTEISKICRNLPYLLQVTEQLIRSSSFTTTKVLQILTTKIKQNVPEQFASVSVLFDLLPSVHLKGVAVKVSLLRRPFSVSTAMKIAEISSDHDASLDLEMLVNCKMISVVEVKAKRKYDTHGLFKDFINYLCSSQPTFDSSLKQGQKQFFEHFSGKMSKLARNLENEFVKTYSKLELNTANFELALDLSEENKEALDLLLHTDDHNHFVLMGIMFEVLKDVNERRDLFAKWADTAEKQENWLASALMRCWQSLQCTDPEGRRLAQPTLDKAHECLKKAEQTASSDQVKEVQSLYLHSSGKMKYYRSTRCARGSKERKDLLTEGIEDLKKAILVRKEFMKDADSTLTSRGWNLIGNCYLDLDEPGEALKYYKDAMEMKKRLVRSDEHWEIPTFYNQIAQVHDNIGRKLEQGLFSGLDGKKKKANEEYEEAAKMTKKALKLQEKLEVSGTKHTAIFQRNLANILLGLGKYDEALEWAQKSYEIRKTLLGQHPDTVKILYTIGTIHEWRDDLEAALHSYEEGVEMEESLPEDGHSAVRNQLYERIEEMCSRVKKNYSKAEKHPEKVRILYLTGVCQEFQENTKALQSFEKALEIEECLPEDGHSLVRKKLYQRLAGMYEKLDQKDKLRKIEMKISKIVEQGEELETGVCEPSEFEIDVYKNGGYYDHSKYGHFIYVPPNTVTEPAKITCKVFNTHPILSPAKFAEGLASYIVELGPATVALQKPIIITLLHSGPVKRHGYEVTVRSFNATDKSWNDIEVLQEVSHAPKYCQCRYLQVSLQKLSTLAVVTSLISDRIQVTPKGCVVRSSVCHDVTVEFPEGAVETTVEGILNILPEERIVLEDSIVARPALLFHGFQGVMFSKPVTIRAPSFSSRTPGSIPLLLRLDFDSQSKEQWKNVTEFHIKDGIMEFSVDHFSAFWQLVSLNVSPNDVVNYVNSCYQNWFNPPSDVTFAAYVKKEQAGQDDVDLQLTCVANDKQDALNAKMNDSFNCLVQSNGDLPMRCREKAKLKVEGVSDWDKDFFLQFLGEDKEERKQFYGTAQKDCRVTKLSYFNDCENRLCTLTIAIRRNLERKADVSHTQVPCKEYFGIALTVLKESPEDIAGKMLKHLKVEGSRLKNWDEEGVMEFYSSLPRDEDCYNDLLTCLDSFYGSKHLSAYLRKGHDLVTAPMTSLSQKIQDKVIDIVANNTDYELSGLADYLEVNESVNECRQRYEVDEQVSQILRKWMVVRDKCSTINALFQALQHLKLSKVEEALAKYTTELSKQNG